MSAQKTMNYLLYVTFTKLLYNLLIIHHSHYFVMESLVPGQTSLLLDKTSCKGLDLLSLYRVASARIK